MRPLRRWSMGLLTVALCAGTVTAAQAAPPATQRASGGTRTATAVALSEIAFDSADVALLARADTHFDAVASAPLAAALDAPLLLTNRDSLPQSVLEELDRLGATEVIILGGTGAVAPVVEQQLRDFGYTTRRVSGKTRFLTAIAIADELAVQRGTPTDRAILAIGSHPSPDRNLWADALAAGNLATRQLAPVLLTDGATLTSDTLAALRRLEVVKITIVGGTGAIAASIQDELQADGFEVARLSGKTRYATALAIVNAARADDIAASRPDPVTTIIIASGADFPDALGGVVAAWKLGGVLVLVPPSGTLGEDLDAWLPRRAGHTERLIVAGGAKAVSDATVATVQRRLDPEGGADPEPTVDGTTDGFDGSSLDTSLWKVRRGDTANITVENGGLHLAMTKQALWYNEQAGLLVSQDVAGDFAVTARVQVRRSSDRTLSPTETIHLGGLAARDPASDFGAENYVFVVAGVDVNDASTEWKTTVNDVSTYDGPFTGRTDAELRICRRGQVFTLLERPWSGGAWTVLQTVDRAASQPLPTTLQVGAVAYTNSQPDLDVRFEEIAFTTPDEVACG